MVKNSSRSYSCKDEELPVICRFALFSLKRDLADFTAFSPRFSDNYANSFETKILTVEELVSPKTETVEKKQITNRLYTNTDKLVSYADRIKGYLQLAGAAVPVSASDFGLTNLRSGIRLKDVEKVLKSLNSVLANIEKYKTALTESGLTESFIGELTEKRNSISADRQQQYEIGSKRKALVEANKGALNELFDQLNEILKIGKILYKGNNPLKLQEYTFTELKKRVRRIVKEEAAQAEE